VERGRPCSTSLGYGWAQLEFHVTAAGKAGPREQRRKAREQ
jgi:hypothetical protein